MARIPLSIGSVTCQVKYGIKRVVTGKKAKTVFMLQGASQ